MGRFRLRLIPREERFLDLLAASAAGVDAGAEALRELVDRYEDVERKVAELTKLEHAGDTRIREIFDALNRSFLTPFDRDDITALATGLDDVLDGIEEAAQRLRVYRIAEPTPLCRRFAHVLASQGRVISRGVPLLGQGARESELRDDILELHRLEKEADQLLNQALGGLYTDVRTVPELALRIQWDDIYRTLEYASDCAERVAVVLQTILVKSE